MLCSIFLFPHSLSFSQFVSYLPFLSSLPLRALWFQTLQSSVVFQVESVFVRVLPLLNQHSTLFGGGVSVGGGVMLTAVIVVADLIGASSVIGAGGVIGGGGLLWKLAG